MSKSTLSIFRIFYEKLFPLVPKDILKEMSEAIDNLEDKEAVSAAEVEDTMITFGYRVWPWHKACAEFVLETEKNIGDHFVLPKLSSDVREKYQKYRQYGVPVENLWSGKVINDYFEPHERAEVSRAVVGAYNDIKNYTTRQIIGLDKDKFLSRVRELDCLLDDIKKSLGELLEIAAREAEHENLAAEIKEKIRYFELGFCLLAPETSKEEASQTVEFFKGRKNDLNRMRGIHRPIEIDFYGE